MRAWVLAILLVGCGNEPNRITYDDYENRGRAAEGHQDWQAAEVEYARAVENVQWGHLSPDIESAALYNLGRVKRKLGKLQESEVLLKRALAIDEQRMRNGDSSDVVACLAELARTLYEGRKFEEGSMLLYRLEPLLKQAVRPLSEEDRTFMKQLYALYSEVRAGSPEGDRFHAIAESF
jgi:tetratricopeptide (TPR) repeat protein